MLGNPAGVHMLLITVGYLALQNDMLLNGLLMVIGFSLFLSLSFFFSFSNELHQLVTNALWKSGKGPDFMLQIFWFSRSLSATHAASGDVCVTNHTLMPLNKKEGEKKS